MNVKRLHQMASLEKAIVMMVWSDIKEMPVYSQWRKYERGFTYEGKPYRYKCKFKVADGHLRLIDTHIEHEQVTIDLIH